jgi:quercetin dioxygenase-like cupin family protein
MPKQIFKKSGEIDWVKLDFLPGTELLPLAEPVPKGSIHKAKLSKGTKIPTHTHPCDEYVYVISGEIETNGNLCKAGDFWITPAKCKQGPHIAKSDVEILTIRLGEMGQFD